MGQFPYTQMQAPGACVQRPTLHYWWLFFGGAVTKINTVLISNVHLPFLSPLNAFIIICGSLLSFAVTDYLQSLYHPLSCTHHCGIYAPSGMFILSVTSPAHKLSAETTAYCICAYTLLLQFTRILQSAWCDQWIVIVRPYTKVVYK